MEPKPPLSKSLPTFKSRVNSISSILSALLTTLENVDKPQEPTQGLSDDLETFHYSLVVLSYHLLADNQRYEDWYDISRITALLKNAEQCFEQIHTLLLNSMRSEFYSVKRYLQASRLEGEMKHLRLRLTISTTALSNPILLSAVHAVHLSFGPKFRTLAFKAVNDWIDQLTHDAIKLARDDGIPKVHDLSANRPPIPRTGSAQAVEERSDLHSDLLVQKEELIKILQVMIGTAMKMVKRSKRDIHTQQTERGAIEMDSSVTLSPAAASASAPAPTLDQDLDPNEILAFQQLALVRTESTEPSPPRKFPLATHLTDDPSEYLTLSPGDNLRSRSFDSSDSPDSYNPSNPATQLTRHYINAQSLLAIGDPMEALSTLEIARSLLVELPTGYSSLSSDAPTATDVLFLMAEACLRTDPKRITRARQVLKEVYTSTSVSPSERRYEAAYMLAQLYMFVDGNPDDPTIDWDGMSMNLDKAKEYVIASVRGRKRLLGLGHMDTQRSIELLTTLCERAGSSGGAVLRELLEVLRGIFSGSDDEGGIWDHGA